MEGKQTAQMVAWLDEERRKDKALITKLEERAASQAALIEDQSRRLHALEGDLAALRNTAITPTTFEDTVARIRADLLTATEQLNSRREATDAEVKKLRDMDRDALMKAIEALRQEMITRLERELQMRRAEEERLSRVASELQLYANNLTKGLEEFERSLTFLEEQRRQDSRRISDMNGEIIELSKRMESQKAKVELLEELARRNERTIGQVSNDLIDFRQQRQSWAEQEALAAEQREQTMNEMLGRMDSFAEEMAAFARQVAGWADTHHTMKKQVEDFDRLADRIDRRLNEVAEVQRLSEERFRQEWEEFLQDDQKRWRQFTLTNEEGRREAQKATDELQTQLLNLGNQYQQMAETIRKLRGVQQDALRSLQSMAQTLREQYDDGLTPLPPAS